MSDEAVKRRRESDAVREARDAFVIVLAALPVAAIGAAIAGTATDDLILWQTRVTAPALVAAVLLGALSAALLLADRAGRHLLSIRPHPIGKVPLIGIAILIGIILVAGLPTTWPIVIGCTLVCLVLGAIVVLGSLRLLMNTRCQAFHSQKGVGPSRPEWRE